MNINNVSHRIILNCTKINAWLMFLHVLAHISMCNVYEQLVCGICLL